MKGTTSNPQLSLPSVIHHVRLGRPRKDF